MTEKVFREHRSAKGYPYWLLEDRFVPRIPDQYLDCVIYLYHSVEDAQRGAIHKNGGSGFLVGIPAAQGPGWHLYAVSNRHVVETSPVIRLNTKAGDIDVLNTSTSNWVFLKTKILRFAGSLA